MNRCAVFICGGCIVDLDYSSILVIPLLLFERIMLIEKVKSRRFKINVLAKKGADSVALCSQPQKIPLKGEDITLLVSQCQQVRCATPIQHDWGTAHEVPGVIRRLIKLFFEESTIDETSGVLPVLWPGITQDVMDLEFGRELDGPLIESGAHQQVSFLSACKDQGDLCRI